ncbi:hypothetical protein M885DRAFT_564739 [Pelagophyceae sp. CCMP2097]|nr:hypothetical protein M885DRAFT_564739 [Pelagophyceae sp. CCMP2097]
MLTRVLTRNAAPLATRLPRRPMLTAFSRRAISAPKKLTGVKKNAWAEEWQDMRDTVENRFEYDRESVPWIVFTFALCFGIHWLVKQEFPKSVNPGHYPTDRKMPMW